MPSNGIRSPYGFTTGAIPFSLIVAAFISPAMATNTDSPIPDLFGQWGRDMLFFEPPPSGPGPVSRARHKSDGSVVVEDLCCTIAPQLFLGDHNNPILKPEAAEAVRKFAMPECSTKRVRSQSSCVTLGAMAR